MIETNRLSVFTTQLRYKSATERADAIAGAIMESGGTFDHRLEGEFPDATHNTLVEISLYGVSAWGFDTGSAVASWIDTARRHLEGNAAA